MTQEEAEQLARKLTRIWAPERAGETPSGWTLTPIYFELEISVMPNMVFRYSRMCFKDYPCLVLERFDGDRKTGGMQCDPSVFLVLPQLKVIPGYAVKKGETKEEFEQFVEEFTPMFRRNCALSGAWELSEHERMDALLDWRDWARTQGAPEAAFVAA